MSPVCLAISSGIVAGHVGLGAALPPLSAAGIEVWPLPTEVISAHGAVPGTRRAELAPGQLKAVIDGLRATRALDRVDAVLTGYLGTPDVAEIIAELIDELCARDHTPFVFCDPVLGDDGRLYLPEQIGEILRDRILPKARYAAPNVTELGWLTGRELENEDAIVAAARSLGCDAVFVTSARRGAEIGVLTVTPSDVLFAGGPDVTRRLSGPGDFVSARILAGLLTGTALPDLAAVAMADVRRAVPNDEARDDLDLTRLYGRYETQTTC